MEIKNYKATIEAILFSCGRTVEIKELMKTLELPEEEIIKIIEEMKQDYLDEGRGIEITN